MRFFLKLKLSVLLLSLCLAANATDKLDETINHMIKIDSKDVQFNAIKGFRDGLKGLLKIQEPSNWDQLDKKYSKSASSQMLDILRELNQKFGNEKASRQALDLVLDEKQNVIKRRMALNSLISLKYEALLPELKSLLQGPLAEDAIRAYASYDSPKDVRSLLAQYSNLDAKKKRVIIETLASRQSYAQELFKVMKKGEIKRTEIPAYIARSMKSLLGKEFSDFFDSGQQAASNKKTLIAKYKKMLNAEVLSKASSSRGRGIYERTCAACHKMYDAGGVIGPDLTGSNRADLDYILLNIVDPSFDVPDNYKMVTIHTNSGQMLMGNVIEEGAGSVTMKMIGQKKVISKSEIKSRQVSKVSMMPEGLLNTLKNDELLDLIKYLQTEKQVELP